MENINLWTLQHKNVYNKLMKEGRFVVASDDYICFDMLEQKDIILFCYNWLQKHSLKQELRPKDAKYHIWATLSKEAAYPGDENSVLIKLSVPSEYVIKLNISKWTSILDYLYLPKDREDSEKHNKKMKELGLFDTKVVLSNCYPDLKEEIIKSWDRLFDDNVKYVNDLSYALLWEIKREWIV